MYKNHYTNMVLKKIQIAYFVSLTSIIRPTMTITITKSYKNRKRKKKKYIALKVYKNIIVVMFLASCNHNAFIIIEGKKNNKKKQQQQQKPSSDRQSYGRTGGLIEYRIEILKPQKNIRSLNAP